MNRLALCLVVLAATAALASGCGESQRVSYERDLAKVGAVVDDALEALPDDDAATIGPEQVAGLADSLRESAEQLADLDPPEDVLKAHRRLEKGLRGIASSFDALAADLRAAKGDEDKGEVFVRFATDEKIEAAFVDVIAAQESFAQQGYRVFGSTPKAPAPAAKAPAAKEPAAKVATGT